MLVWWKEGGRGERYHDPDCVVAGGCEDCVDVYFFGVAAGGAQGFVVYGLGWG